MTAAASPRALAGLAARLTDPQDRETYAGLISFIDSLPENDELFRLAQLLGLVSLVAERMPDAMADFLATIRQETKTTADYRSRLEERLARLPDEFAAGVDPAAIANAMAERFRQQIAVAGLQESSVVVKQFKALSDEVAQSQRALAKRYSEVTATISAELAKLEAASNNLREHNAVLVSYSREESWVRPLLLGFVLLLVGGLFGIFAEKFEIDVLLGDISAEMRSAQKNASPVPAAAVAQVVHPQVRGTHAK